MTEAVVVAHQFDDPLQQRKASDLGMWIFLATEVLFLGAMFVAYTASRIHHPDAFAIASKLTNLTLGTVNTGVLLTSSLMMALSVRSTKLGLRGASIAFLLATAVLGLAFLGIKFTEYYLDWRDHLVPVIDFAHRGPRAGEVETFFYLYFFMTGVHSIHLILGIVTVLVLAWMAWRRDFSPDYFTPVELGGLYWHLVDIVWIFLYPLLYLVSRT